jgi:hypothetical protein
MILPNGEEKLHRYKKTYLKQKTTPLDNKSRAAIA